MFIICKRFLSYLEPLSFSSCITPDISTPHMAMFVLLSHFSDIDGLIGEVETYFKPLQLWPTQEQ